MSAINDPKFRLQLDIDVLQLRRVEVRGPTTKIDTQIAELSEQLTKIENAEQQRHGRAH